MGAALPQSIIDMYKERVNTTHDLIESSLERAQDIPINEIKSQVHKIAGTAHYFDDDIIGTTAKSLEETMNQKDTTPTTLKPFLKVFQEHLTKSHYYAKKSSIT